MADPTFHDDICAGLSDEPESVSTSEIRVESTRIGDNGTYRVIVKLDDDILAAEKIDTMKPKARADFVDRLCKGRPGLDRAGIEKILLGLAADSANKPAMPTSEPAEIDISHVVRPELFHTAEVSGVAVPIASAAGGEATAAWAHYLQWHADGRRERAVLAARLDLPGGAQLWVHPQPAEPTPTMRPGWSAAARRAWLDGAEAPNAATVFAQLCERIAYFVEFPPDTAAGTTATLALWVMMTYAYFAWPAIPYLSIGGPLGSGKSTLFRILERVAFRPIASSNMTAACLFRTLHDLGGTLFLDEAERLRDGTPDAAELRSILLSGYKPGSPAMRLEKVGDGFRQVAFDVFGPKAIASIANPPESLASRGIRITMFRAAADSPKPRRRLDAEPHRWQAIRDDLHALALAHGPTWIELAGRSDVLPKALANRDGELWQPLLALAAFIEDAGARGLLALMQAHAVAVATESQDDATPDADETLLRILAGHVAAGTQDGLKPINVLKRAQEIDSATFAKWSAKGISNTFKKYGLKTHKGHGSIGKTYSKVTVEALRRIESAYSLDLDLPG